MSFASQPTTEVVRFASHMVTREGAALLAENMALREEQRRIESSNRKHRAAEQLYEQRLADAKAAGEAEVQAAKLDATASQALVDKFRREAHESKATLTQASQCVSKVRGLCHHDGLIVLPHMFTIPMSPQA